MSILCLAVVAAAIASPGPTAPTTPLRDEFNRPIALPVDPPIAPKEPARPRRPRTKQPPPRCPDGMAYVRGGRYGAKSIRHFCLDITEVTVEQFFAYTETLRVARPPRTVEIEALTLALASVTRAPDDTRSAQCTWRAHAELRTHPINCVSHHTATEFCAAHGKRLPHSLEWQWAARHGKKAHTYPWGGGLPAQTRLNLASRTSPGRLTRVGLYPVCGAGLHDMAGNVAEWVLCDEARTSCPVRGGHFQTTDPKHFRVTHVDLDHPPDERSELIGFRCAAEPRKRSKR